MTGMGSQHSYIHGSQTRVNVMRELTASEIVSGCVAVDTNTKSVHASGVWDRARRVDVITGSACSACHWHCDNTIACLHQQNSNM